ncbi:hypothetical protein R83H12_01130 [Fibrobacteria bacterium R8-3-H12]
MKTFAKYLLFCGAALAFWACSNYVFDYESGNLKSELSSASSSSSIVQYTQLPATVYLDTVYFATQLPATVYLDTVAFNVQYTLASEFSNEPHSTTVISSKNEIEEYYKNQQIKICDEQDDVGWSNGFGWKEQCNTIEKYSDSYFADNFLVIIDNIWEPSGSYKHKVERIDENGEIVISRLMPSPFNDDIGEWGIIIELNNSFKVGKFKAVFVDVKLW